MLSRKIEGSLEFKVKSRHCRSMVRFTTNRRHLCITENTARSLEVDAFSTSLSKYRYVEIVDSKRNPHFHSLLEQLQHHQVFSLYPPSPFLPSFLLSPLLSIHPSSPLFFSQYQANIIC